MEYPLKVWSSSLDGMKASILFWTGLSRYVLDFMAPMLKVTAYFNAQELEKLKKNPFELDPSAYLELFEWNMSLAASAWQSSQDEFLKYYAEGLEEFLKAIKERRPGKNGDSLAQYVAEKAKAIEKLVVMMPAAVKAIKKEYGFHFEEGYEKVAETDRMLLYRVIPDEIGVETNETLKPVLVAHPYVLGPNIVAFLPKERKSFVHTFANQGVPTYVRIIKEIDDNPAVQVMTGEDDVIDTKYFSRIIVNRHNKPLTLAGVCQGGFIFLADLLSGELDGLVDALITVASPLDGTKSTGLKSYLDHINYRFRTMGYSEKTLPNGNRVVDGDVMSWIYKLKSIEKEAPLFTYFRDLQNFQQMNGKPISKTAAAINYWLVYDRTDLPIAITDMSRLSYTIPISAEGDLPVRLFGKELNLHHLEEKGIKLLICYGAQDELVEPPSATAPAEHIPAELTEFPKGHAAILTSWSNPESEYALHKTYPNGTRGPVRFHLDLDKELSKDKLTSEKKS